MPTEQQDPPAPRRFGVRYAGMQNYLLGGKDHFAPERVLGSALRVKVPRLVEAEVSNRIWRSRTVARLAGAGMRQFVDLNAGFPDNHHTHVVAQGIAEDAKVVYADADPTVMVHGRALDISTGEGALAHLTLDAPFAFADLLQHEGVLSVLDPDLPIAVIACGFLQFASDLAVARHEITALVATLAPGSYLAVSHPISDSPAHGWGPAADAARTAGIALQAVPLAQVCGYLDGLELIEPGWQPTTAWLSGEENAPEPTGEAEYWAAIGHKS